MGTEKKPSKNEDEYFAKRDAELLKAQREASARAAREKEREAHFMKCPKCGADLEHERYHGIEVDRCSECHGVWFDVGEVETLLGHEERGFVPGIFQAIWSVGKGERKPRPVE